MGEAAGLRVIHRTGHGVLYLLIMNINQWFFILKFNMAKCRAEQPVGGMRSGPAGTRLAGGAAQTPNRTCASSCAAAP